MLRRVRKNIKKSEAYRREKSRRSLGLGFFAFYKNAAASYLRKRAYVKRTAPTDFDFNACLIETIGICNRQCSFCHNNPEFPQRKKGIMDESLFRKIIDELSELGFCGRISHHSFGEPLMDKRLPRLISYTRDKCPYAFIKFDSNGDFLTEKLLLELITAGLDKISINNYDDSDKPLLKLLKKKYPYFVNYKESKNFKKYQRPQMDGKNNPLLSKPCMEPTNKFVINWEGKVILCCQDIYAKYCMGNLNEESILAIARREAFKNSRRTTSQGYRQKIAICERCDHP